MQKNKRCHDFDPLTTGEGCILLLLALLVFALLLGALQLWRYSRISEICLRTVLGLPAAAALLASDLR
jgi:hypothetical protein